MLNITIPIDESVVIAAIERAAEKVARERISKAEKKTERLLKYDEVMHLTGLSKSAIYKGKDLPAPVIVGKDTKRWRESEIIAYIERLKR